MINCRSFIFATQFNMFLLLFRGNKNKSQNTTSAKVVSEKQKTQKWWPLWQQRWVMVTMEYFECSYASNSSPIVGHRNIWVWQSNMEGWRCRKLISVWSVISNQSFRINRSCTVTCPVALYYNVWTSSHCQSTQSLSKTFRWFQQFHLYGLHASHPW